MLYGYDGLSDLGVEVVVRRPGSGVTSNVKRSAGILLPGWSSAYVSCGVRQQGLPITRVGRPCYCAEPDVVRTAVAKNLFRDGYDVCGRSEI